MSRKKVNKNLISFSKIFSESRFFGICGHNFDTRLQLAAAVRVTGLLLDIDLLADTAQTVGQLLGRYSLQLNECKQNFFLVFTDKVVAIIRRIKR